MPSAPNDVCLEAAQYAKIPSMAQLLLFKIITCTVAAGCSLLLLFLKKWRWLVHPNAKFLFTIHVFFSCVLPLGYIVVYVYDYHRITAHYSNPCDYLVPAVWSLFSRFVPVIGLMGEMLSMFFLAIERAVSTWYKEKYEQHNNCTLAICLTVVVFFASFLAPFFFLIYGEELDYMMTTYTMLTRTNQFKYQLLVNIETGVEMATIIIFLAVYVVNKAHRRTQSLGINYQVAENVKVAGRLLQVFVIHSFFLLVNSFGLALFIAFVPTSDVATHKILMESVGQVQLYSIIMPLFITWRTYCRKNKVAVVSTDTAKQLYFAGLAKQWEIRPS